VWLNNPVAPLEASGTSGIKAAVNGRLNLSVLDGWWAEAFENDNGWGIPPVDVADPQRRDSLEAELLLDTLEEEVREIYYQRNAAGVPEEWVRRCKRAMSSVIPKFNMRRTVSDYARGVYLPAALQAQRLNEHDHAGAKALADWKQRARLAWPKLEIRALGPTTRDLPHAERLRLRVAVQLAGLAPNDVRLELVGRQLLPELVHESPLLCSYGRESNLWQWREELRFTGDHEADGAAVFALDAEPRACGQYAVEVRAYPWHELMTHPFEMGLMKWLEQ
jgi:starch phosphorylase